MSDELTTAIENSATAGIASHAEDGRSTTAMSINDQIAAAKYLRSQATVDDECIYGGASHRKIVPPGAY